MRVLTVLKTRLVVLPRQWSVQRRTIPRASRVPTNHKSGAFRLVPLRFVSTAMKEARIYLD
jgi:hypothetical protein